VVAVGDQPEVADGLADAADDAALEPAGEAEGAGAPLGLSR
jgi:hypothetical protein